MEVEVAKRQIDTSIVQQNWYMELDSRARNLWWHLFLSCDNIGVFEVNTRLIGVFTGERFSKEDIFSMFGGRVVPVPDHPDKGIIVDFVRFQSRGGAAGNAPWQRAMRSRMSELGIDEEWLQGVSQSKSQGESGGGDAPEDSEDDAEEGAFDEDNAFSVFWDAYPPECPRKVDRKKCRAKFALIMRDAEDKEAMLQKMLDGLARWRRCDTWVRDGGRFIRAPLVWLNGECWNDAPAEVDDVREKSGGRAGRRATNWRKPNIADSDASLL